MKFPAALFLLLAPALFAAPPTVTSFHKDPDGVTFATSSGAVKIQVCTDRIVRIIGSPTDRIPTNKSFVVTRDWRSVPFKVEAGTGAVVIVTRNLRVNVSRDSGAVTFLDRAGNVLLAENPGARRFTPHGEFFTAEDSFASPPDEFLYGLGQYQEGLWNWRGLTRELRQHNTTSVLPVLVSSKGYGLLWDNASLTDFNPLDNEVPLTLVEDTNTNSNSGKAPKIATWRGTFTSGAAGEYVFFAKADNNREEFSISVDGREIAGVTNYWTPAQPVRNDPAAGQPGLRRDGPRRQEREAVRRFARGHDDVPLAIRPGH